VFLGGKSLFHEPSRNTFREGNFYEQKSHSLGSHKIGNLEVQQTSGDTESAGLLWFSAEPPIYIHGKVLVVFLRDEKP